MLLLMRRAGESVHMTGGITLTVLRVRDGRVRLGIEAPPNIIVQRSELLASRPAVQHPPPRFPRARSGMR